MEPIFLNTDERERGLEELLEASHRHAVPIRETFLQRRGSPPRPGPLSRIVSGGHHHALDLYLLIHAATATPPHHVAINPRFWARLVARPDQSERSARRALDRSVATLEHLALIRPVTRLGVPVVELLDEYGWGGQYMHPSSSGERYFQLPHAYWTLGFDRALSLSAKAMLLLARSLRPTGFTLPLANARTWYGISADTMRRGMKELVAAGLAKNQANAVESEKAPLGKTIRRTYILVGDMAREEARGRLS